MICHFLIKITKSWERKAEIDGRQSGFKTLLAQGESLLADDQFDKEVVGAMTATLAEVQNKVRSMERYQDLKSFKRRVTLLLKIVIIENK